MSVSHPVPPAAPYYGDPRDLPDRADEPTPTTPAPSRTPRPAPRATTLVRRPKLWLIPAVLATLVALFLSLLYMGGILNPNGNLHRLPIALVDADTGAPLPGQQQNLGTQVAQAVVAGCADRASSTGSGSARREAQDMLASGKVYGALEIPADFTASVAALTTGQAPPCARPSPCSPTRAWAAWAPRSPPRSRRARRTRRR